MNCAYHTYNVANVNCNGCGKPLCPACDHRIKGFPYCQDCIVQGVELLRSQTQSSYSQVVKSQTSPVLAFILSFCPGLGAAYNGQTAKALVHFGISVGMLQMMLQSRMIIFFFGFLGMWLYSAVDAWKTARLLKRGVPPEIAKDLLTQRFSGSLKLWAILLIILGILFFIDTKFLMRGLLPLMLIGLGVYILQAHIFKKNPADSKDDHLSSYAESAKFISSGSQAVFQDENFVSSGDFSRTANLRRWKNR